MCKDILLSAPDTTRLDDFTVHLWHARLDSNDEEVAHFRKILSTDERVVADRFVFDLDRKRYIVAHGVLRSILALYLEMDPKQVTFSYSPHGKPALSKKLKDTNISFNLSHTRDRAFFGFAHSRDIGVDIEFICDNFDFMSVAETNFSPREYSTLVPLPDNMKKEAFFHYWTCKEAYMKAIGMGLSLPMDKVEISSFTDSPVILLDSGQGNVDSGRWKLKTINYEPGYAAAVVVEGKDWNMKLYHW